MSNNGVHRNDNFRGMALEVYLLPLTPWSEAVALQQRLVYEVSGVPRNRAALILCEHHPIITVGRQGSMRHVRIPDEERRAADLDIRWSNRGGGCWLHWPGQLVAYPIVPLCPRSFGLERYRSLLYDTLVAVLDEFEIAGARDLQATGVRVGDRDIAHVGVAVKQWVAYHGCVLNVCAPLDRFDGVQANPLADRPMTSMFRERRLPIRTTTVRESFLRHFMSCFGFRRHFLCNPPGELSCKRAANVAT